MQKYQNNVITNSGQPFAGANVLVLTYPGGTPATIYSDNGVTVALNPLIADRNGYFGFYAADGHYSFTVSGLGIQPVSYTDILFEDILSGDVPTSGPIVGTESVGFTQGGVLVKSIWNTIATFIFSIFTIAWISGIGAVARTLLAKLQDLPITPKDFGAKGDGTTDDTAALIAFLAALPLGKSGYIPSGYYIFSSPLTIPTTFNAIAGDGKYSSVLVYTGSSTAIDLLSVIGASNSSLKGPAVISGIGLRSNTVMTGGAALHFKWAGHITTQDIATGAQYDPNHNLWNGIYYQNTDFQILDDFEICVQNEGLQVSGTGAGNPGPQYDLWCSAAKVSGCAVGVHIGGGFDNAYFDRMMVTTNGINVVIDNALAPFKNQEIGFGPQFVTDQAQTGDNYYINDTLANNTNYGQIMIAGPVTGCKSGHGIHVKTWPGCYVNVSSPYIAGNAQTGIFIEDSSSKVVVSAATNISQNGGWGIFGGFANTKVIAPGIIEANGNGSYNANVVNHLNNVTIGDVTPQAGTFTSITGPLVGTATNNNASTGIVGEYLSASAIATPLTTATPATAASLPLSAGDWDVTGLIKYIPAGTTALTSAYAGINGSPAALPADSQFANNLFPSFTPAAPMRINAPVVRLSLATAATVYLIAQSAFSTSTMTCDGYLRARRVR